jgi:hypothetical protein
MESTLIKILERIVETQAKVDALEDIAARRALTREELDEAARLVREFDEILLEAHRARAGLVSATTIH